MTKSESASPHRDAAARPGRVRWLLTRVAGLLAAAVVLFLVGFAAFLFCILGPDDRTGRTADGIVVLTGGADRVAEAANLLADQRGRRLLITGVHPETTLVEIGRTVPVAQTVLDCCAELGRSALNTRGNAIEAAQWAHRLGFRSLIVVTSGWHMPRALVEMERAMPDVELLPYPVAGVVRPGPWGVLASGRMLLLEYVKYLAAYAGIRPSPATTDELTALSRPHSPKSTT
ncbi:YdcF family protein [Ancylobacter sp. Lp-2]|uniref:YdcF family protein n=1 Tax=Ancylobacter sp. Lp-2 TaxID=2881339 RepID=UPI001E4877DC|nr:YdcF family protein [Ancylobacter sp. Lp-2]